MNSVTQKGWYSKYDLTMFFNWLILNLMRFILYVGWETLNLSQKAAIKIIKHYKYP